MSKNTIDNLHSMDCGIEFTLSVIGGKWKLLILWLLSKNGKKRYGEIRRFIPTVTNKMLSQQLKEMVQSGLITRKDYNQVPPKVEYIITKKGLSFEPMLDFMCEWGIENEDIIR